METPNSPILIVCNSEQPVYPLGFIPAENVNSCNYHYYAVGSLYNQYNCQMEFIQ